MNIRFYLVACLVLGAGPVSAKIVPHPLFTDHAVLQQGQTVPVWGTGEPEERVEVTFRGQRVSTAAGADGRWMVTLMPMEASAEPAVLRIDDTLIKDVLVGEVWVCSGQSNMAMPVRKTLGGEDAAAKAEAGEHGTVRLFKVPQRAADERLSGVMASWQECSGESVSAFSATGFYFGRALQEALGVPVGLIEAAVGGTNAYSWIAKETFTGHAGAALAREWYAEQLEALPAAKERFEAARERHAEKLAAWEAGGSPLKGRSARAPLPPMGPGHPKRPMSLYNAMVAPLQPFAIKGVVWYQGEANARAPWAPNYDALMGALIEGWRRDWNQAENRDFPFYLVQLPNCAKGDAWGWPVVRESMFEIWRDVKNTGMVVTLDVGDANDVHPKNKAPVGERLARFARGSVYGEEIVISGPVQSTALVTDEGIELSFAHVGGGLVSADGQPLKYFTIAGEDLKFVEAQAEIRGDKVVVSSPEVAKPVAVRYAWLNNPEAPNFVNKEGLPAAPFRTDRGP